MWTVRWRLGGKWYELEVETRRQALSVARDRWRREDVSWVRVYSPSKEVVREAGKQLELPLS